MHAVQKAMAQSRPAASLLQREQEGAAKPKHSRRRIIADCPEAPAGAQAPAAGWQVGVRREVLASVASYTPSSYPNTAGSPEHSSLAHWSKHAWLLATVVVLVLL